jgi:hypothetical protein
MKRIPIIFTVAVIIAASCNNNTNTSTAGHENHDTTQSASTTSQETDAVKAIKPVFTNLGAEESNHIKYLFDHYIHVKTALSNSNSGEAQQGATAIVRVVKAFDRSLLDAQHKEAYDKSIGEIRSAAQAISSSQNLEKQREHFAVLSQHAYDLAKAFGGGKTLYHDHCPMAFNEKGAMWLSEQQEIRNPYFGEKMPDCGTVEERIEK